MPRFQIGVHPSGDWRYAIDFMRRVRPPASVEPPTPAWLREAGAIYASSGGGYGAIYLAPEFAPVDLRDRLAELLAWPGASFRSLPFLLKQARNLGTDVLYLADYWEPATSAPPPDYNDGERSPYWNKGDYLPRQDLGGEAAFIEGIRGVHSAGGRVILYVEPFILFDRSQVFQALTALDLDEKEGAHRFEPASLTRMPQNGTSTRMVSIIGVRRPSTCHGRTISSAFANAWSDGMEPTASFWTSGHGK